MKIQKINMKKPRIAVLGEHPGAKRLKKSLESQGYEVDHFHSWAMLFNLLKAGRSLSVYHAHTLLSTIAMKMASWITRVPTVSHVHETHVFQKNWTPMKFLERVIYQETQYTQQLSSSEAFTKHKNVNQNQVVVTPGIDTEAFETMEAKRHSDGFHVLYAGPLQSWKGLDNLLNAAHQLVHSNEFIQSHKDFVLHIMGSGPELENLKKKIMQMEMQKYVRFHGVKKGEKRVQVFKDADLFVLPSYLDALPYELLEAAAAGLPILASHTGDIGKVVLDNQNGHLIPPGDVRELGYYLQYFALNPQLGNMGSASLNHIKENFQEDASLDKIMRVYNSILNGTSEKSVESAAIMPWQLPRLLMQSRRFNAVRRSRKPLQFCFTVNVEQAYSFSELPHEVEHIDSFMKRFSEFCEQLDVQSTLFVQRDLMETLLEDLEGMQEDGHEIGVHALNSDWQDRPTRRKMLRQMRDEQKDLGIAPKMFRAPQGVDDTDLGILHEQGYEFLPVSQDPKPQVEWHRGLPFGSVLRLNLENILRMSDEELLSVVNRLRNVQHENGLDPFLIFECHSWEFQSRDHAAHASGENFSKLAQKIAFLKGHMELNFMTLSSFCSSLEPAKK